VSSVSRQGGRGWKCGAVFDIGVVIFTSAVVENVEVVVVLMSGCCWELKLHRPAETVRFLHGGCPWFSRSPQVLERAIFTRETSKHPELDPRGPFLLIPFRFVVFAKKACMGFVATPSGLRGVIYVSALMQITGFDVDTSTCGVEKTCFLSPTDCTTGKCDFLLTWTDAGNAFSFEMTSSAAAGSNSWVAFGLSLDQDMVITAELTWNRES